MPESLIGRISGPQGRLLLELQTQTNTLIRISPKPVFVSGLQSHVISVCGDQMNVNYAAAVIENTITIEQLNQHAGVLQQAPLCRPYEESTYMGQISGKSNGIDNTGDYGSVEGSNSVNPSCPSQTSQPPPKQPAF